jgi:hypothetical protein
LKLLSVALKKTRRQIVGEMILRTFDENEKLVSEMVSRQKQNVEVKKLVDKL